MKPSRALSAYLGFSQDNDLFNSIRNVKDTTVFRAGWQ